MRGFVGLLVLAGAGAEGWCSSFCVSSIYRYLQQYSSILVSMDWFYFVEGSTRAPVMMPLFFFVFSESHQLLLLLHVCKPGLFVWLAII